MNKPASELIALADDLARDASTYQAGTPTRKLLHRAADALRSAANQSGSERAGVDALREALARMVYETTHLSAEWDDGSHDCRISKATLAKARQALATPPAQPAPAGDIYDVLGDPTGHVDTPRPSEATFGCKRAGGFVDTSCLAPCDCDKTQRLAPSEAPSTHGKPDGAMLPKRPFAFAVRRAPENGEDQWRLFMDESEARAEAEQLDGDYECLFRVGDRRSAVDALTVTAQVASAVRVWLECPAEKRPSAQALGIRVAEIAALSPQIAAAETSPGDVTLADELEAAANWMQLYLDTFGEIGDDATQANIDDWHDIVKRARLTAPQQQSSEAWRYEIQYGPDGETDYAWVYDEKNNLVCTAKTHHAIAIVRALATPPAQPAPASGDKPNDNFPGSPKATDLCIDCGGSRKYPSGADCISCDGSGRVFEGDGIKPHGKPDGAVREAYSALCEPRESDAYDNLDGALIDIKRLSESGKPTDQVCIRTIERVLRQLLKAQQALHSPKIAAAETGPGDALDACPLCFGTGRHEGRFGHNDPDCTNCNGTGIDRLDVKAEAKSQEPDAVASYPWPKALCVYRHEGNYWHGDISFARAPTDAEINALGAFLRDHHENTTKPEAPAVSVDAIARLIDPDSFCLCDETGGLLRTVECDEATTKATAIAALIAGGR